ncbi:MAG: cyclic-di-AMP receptor [Clostridia bacterium]|nr:cyclic-di-AMP receptor [Clostridia bacterium]
MKLMIAVVQDEDASKLVGALMDAGFGVTKLATTGGFLRAGNTTVLVGVEDELLAGALDVVEKTCKSRKAMTTVPTSAGGTPASFMSFPVEVNVGGATVFVLNVEQFIKH